VGLPHEVLHAGHYPAWNRTMGSSRIGMRGGQGPGGERSDFRKLYLIGTQDLPAGSRFPDLDPAFSDAIRDVPSTLGGPFTVANAA
jgi:hypothetical protein